MFLGPMGFLLGQGNEVDWMEIKKAVGLKIKDWLKFIFKIILLLLLFLWIFSILL